METQLQEEFFSFVEKEGFDRRHAILEVYTEGTGDGKYTAEVFDTASKTLVWNGRGFLSEKSAFKLADEILTKMERVHGFGSISLGTSEREETL